MGLSNQPNIAAVAFALGLVFAIGLIVQVGLRRYWYVGVCAAVLVSNHTRPYTPAAVLAAS